MIHESPCCRFAPGRGNPLGRFRHYNLDKADSMPSCKPASEGQQSEGAGAPEVTEDMVAAGAEALQSFLESGSLSYEFVAERVYMSMARVSDAKSAYWPLGAEPG